MNKHWKYARYILRHKLYVFVEGRRLGLGIVQLLVLSLVRAGSVVVLRRVTVMAQDLKDAFGKVVSYDPVVKLLAVADFFTVRPTPAVDVIKRQKLVDAFSATGALGGRPAVVFDAPSANKAFSVHCLPRDFCSVLLTVLVLIGLLAGLTSTLVLLGFFLVLVLRERLGFSTGVASFRLHSGILTHGSKS